jgi:hypothetical protein
VHRVVRHHSLSFPEFLSDELFDQLLAICGLAVLKSNSARTTDMPGQLAFGARSIGAFVSDRHANRFACLPQHNQQSLVTGLNVNRLNHLAQIFQPLFRPRAIDDPFCALRCGWNNDANCTLLTTNPIETVLGRRSYPLDRFVVEARRNFKPATKERVEGAGRLAAGLFDISLFLLLTEHSDALAEAFIAIVLQNRFD